MMICYMPFTYLPERGLSTIFTHLGTLTAYAPVAGLVPEHMQKAAVEGRVELRPVKGVDADRLMATFRAYQQWAELHQDNLADMAGLFKTARDRFAMMDDSNPSQISTQIRRFGDAGPDQVEDPLFQAALFISVAQDYDRQQDAMHQGLGAVHTMERDMMVRLSGDTTSGSDPALDHSAAGPPAALEPGGFMTASRLEAWAQLALQDTDSLPVYLTISPAVIDYLLDVFPETEIIAHLDLPADPADPRPTQAQWREAFTCLAQTPEPQPELLAGFARTDDAASAGLSLYRLSGIHPRAMLRRLCPPGVTGQTVTDPGHGQFHTVIALAAIS